MNPYAILKHCCLKMIRDSIVIILVCCLIGMLEGFLSGLLGIGGGIILIPAFLLVFPWFGLPSSMQLAVGTALAAMTFTMCSALQGHFSRGDQKLLWDIGRRFIVGVITGTLAGPLVSMYLSTKQLTFLFGIIIWLLALRVLFLKDISRYAVSKKDWRLPHNVWLTLITFLIALIASMTGVGGGVLMVTYLQMRHVPMRIAIPLALLIHIPEAILGAVTYIAIGYHAPHLPAWTTGYVYWPAVLGIISTSIFMAQVGVKASHKTSENFLRWFFIIFAISTGIRMVFFS